MELFDVPEIKGYTDQGTTIPNAEVIKIGEDARLFEAALSALSVEDEELMEYFQYVVSISNLKYPPTTWEEGRDVFLKIIQYAKC